MEVGQKKVGPGAAPLLRFFLGSGGRFLRKWKEIHIGQKKSQRASEEEEEEGADALRCRLISCINHA